MKKSLFFLCVVLLLGGVCRAQSVGFGSSPPQTSALADINSTGKGLLIPRMGPAAISAIANPAKGLMVYDSVSHQLKINIGTSTSVNWQPLLFNNGWGLHGNGGTNPAVNFVGSTALASSGCMDWRNGGVSRHGGGGAVARKTANARNELIENATSSSRNRRRNSVSAFLNFTAASGGE